MLALFFLRLFLAIILGMKNSWLIIVLVLVYVGGIIIMFTYITRVLRYSKISLVRLRGLVRMLLTISVLSINLILSPKSVPEMWPAISFISENIPFLLFLVNYILLTLISVFIIVRKEEGPMKIK